MPPLFSARCIIGAAGLLAAMAAAGQTGYVDTLPSPGCFCLAARKSVAAVYVDAADYPGVIRAAENLRTDLARVTGLIPAPLPEGARGPTNVIIIGTLGHSPLIARLLEQKKIDASSIRDQWESFLVQVVANPLPGVGRGLVILGSDKRGSIYGIYDLSEQIGVSPWYWWADVPVRHRGALFAKPGCYSQGPPAVKYRGLFLNDEAPSLTGWTKEKFGGYNHAFYTNVFELILRLKGNFLWPAMWDNSFATDDPLTPRLADEYGVVIGTSHHEPMMRAWKEWERAGNPKGSWDYSKNPEKLRQFWEEGLRRTRDYEKIITLGMRGDGDEPMSETESVALLEKIVADQRTLIAKTLSPNLAAVPQVWALYKEVQGYYERGMRVPDDITLLWCDDNWGNLRRLPTPEEVTRRGGAGIYYHFDYVGGPRNYKWLNTVPITKVWEQMNLADAYGANQIWIVNVGDLKPMEFPLEFFLQMAWDPTRWPKARLAEYTRRWAEREFGSKNAAEIANLISGYTKFNGRRKPELIDPATFSLVDYREAERVADDWKALVARAEAINNRLPKEARDAFFQLVLYPVKASAIVNELYITAGRNRWYAGQGRAAANDLAAQTRALFQADADLACCYNRSMAHGKWNHMMDQTHIGYTSWQQPASNTMPEVVEIQLPQRAQMGVAVEGSALAWPGASAKPALPGFDAFNRPRRFVDVFNRGKTPFTFSATASADWLRVSPRHSTVAQEKRLWVSVDWAKAPHGATNASLTITGTGTSPVVVNVNLFNPETPTRDSLQGFVEADGYVSIEAEHHSRKIDARSARWEPIADYGRTLSSMTLFPVTAPSVTPPLNSPCLEYQLYLFDAGQVEVEALLAPTLNFVPGRGLRFGISFDDQPVRIIDALARNSLKDWEETVKDNVRKIRSTHTVAPAGYHTLKFWMVDPGVVLQKLVLDFGGIKPSYLGPPESFRGPARTGAGETQKSRQ